MNNVTGKISVEELRQRIADGKVETIIMAFIDHYGRLMGKRFDAEFFLESGLDQGTHACNYLLTTDMEMEPVGGYAFANWEMGYGDFHLIPDLNTLRIASWLRRSAIVLCDLVNESSHQLISVSPRSIMQNQIARTKEFGYECYAASELEYYLFNQSYRQAHQQGYTNIEAAGWYLEDYHILQGSRTEKFTAAARRNLKKSGIPVENSKGEWGLGQHEINIKYAEALEMADRHILFKQCLKEIADKQGVSVTFMAKYHEDQAGSSCHLHLSLWQDGKNIFPGSESFGPIKCSQLFRWFLAGWIRYVPDVMPFYAPTINSYKRYVDGSWAPTRLAWSHDNRTAGFRVVGSGQSLRIECRIPGADCNPYLAFAAALASGLKGIEDQLEPPEVFSGDMYGAKHLQAVPSTLEEALKVFSQSSFTKESFGVDVVEHYTHFFKSEVQAYYKSVTDWERKRYFERI